MQTVIACSVGDLRLGAAGRAPVADLARALTSGNGRTRPQARPQIYLAERGAIGLRTTAVET